MSSLIKLSLLLTPLFLCLTFQPINASSFWKNLRQRKSTPRQSPACRYSFSFTTIGQAANLDSPNFPANYPGFTDCQYFIQSPAGTTMKLQCGNSAQGTYFNVENSNNCVYDMFYMSLSGDSGFRDQIFACGKGMLEKESLGNKLAVGFRSDGSDPPSNTAYGFRCKVTVVANQVQPPAPPPPPPVRRCDCGVRNENTRIVGGEPAGNEEFPWRCALYSRSLGVFCGCSVISQNWILTAAHCTRAVPNGEDFYVNVGDYDISSSTDADSQLIKVGRVMENPAYNSVTQDSDTSLLQLSTPLTFRRGVLPVCLPWKFRNADFKGATVTSSGWGTTSFGGSQSSILQQVDLPVLTTSECKSYYPTSITDNMICTYSNGKDTCQGDSGGSIDYRDPDTGNYYAIGVVSWGVGCAGKDKPGVYAKVTKYLDWIEQTTGDNFCKA